VLFRQSREIRKFPFGNLLMLFGFFQ
jgi:hypothetical protein